MAALLSCPECDQPCDSERMLAWHWLWHHAEPVRRMPGDLFTTKRARCFCGAQSFITNMRAGGFQGHCDEAGGFLNHWYDFHLQRKV